MTVWALSDLHLSFGTPNKSMEIFGPQWKNWTDKIYDSCHAVIKKDDLLLIAGDISWATTLEQVSADLLWIAALPGTKLLLKGNHDYWWPSKTKLQQILPPSLHFIQYDAFHWNDVTIGGARLWDTPEYGFSSLVDVQDTLINPPTTLSQEELLANEEKIFKRELIRLHMSLDQLSSDAKYKVAMTHYPPIGLDLKPSRTSAIMDIYGIDYCVFGHLHNLNTHKKLFGIHHKTTYVLTSCDYLEFAPVKIL